MELIGRQLQPLVAATMEWARVVVVHGARQSGKTTLVQAIAAEKTGTYVSLDDDTQRALAEADPISYLLNQRHPLAIDEVQLGGDRLIRSIKQVVDAEQTPGRFLLSGSTNFLTVPNISESLAGRVQIFSLSPISEAELASRIPTEINSWFEGKPHLSPVESMSRDAYLALVCRGGYPEVIPLDPKARRRWFSNYITTVVQRDIATLADIRKTAVMSSLLRWTAGLTSSNVNVSEAARRLQTSRPAISSYFEWLQTVFLINALPAWSRGISSRPTRQAKFHLIDSGLAASLLEVTPESLTAPTATATGPLLETFVFNEIDRQLSSAEDDIRLSHYRDNQGREIDLVLEGFDGGVVAVEIKATRSPTSSQLQHLAWLRDKLDVAAPGSFRSGVLLHTGDQSGKISDRLYLRPISALWSG